jgi:ectoine hydroxylase-related dioxygenase (phytanoyl-CoA dioxygenase family)
MPRPITASEIAHWEEHGYVLAEDFLSEEELKLIRDEVAEYLPSWAELRAEPEKYPNVARHAFDWIDFPFNGDVLSSVAVSPEILDFLRVALDGADPYLTHCLLWPKYAGTHDFEQQLHLDYPNNTLTYPRDDGMFRAIPFIAYLTYVTVDLGPTWVVSQQVTGAAPGDFLPERLTPEGEPEAYEAQEPVTAPAGSLLIYSLRTFHRGSAFKAEAGERFTLNFGYRSAHCQWVGHGRGWAARGPFPEMARFLSRATPEQRSVLGFPRPGDPYWNEHTRAAVARRYPEMDMTPYG